MFKVFAVAAALCVLGSAHATTISVLGATDPAGAAQGIHPVRIGDPSSTSAVVFDMAAGQTLVGGDEREAVESWSAFAPLNSIQGRPLPLAGFAWLDNGSLPERLGSVQFLLPDRPFLSGKEATRIPLPAAAWLFGSALVGFVMLANRRKV